MARAMVRTGVLALAVVATAITTAPGPTRAQGADRRTLRVGVARDSGRFDVVPFALETYVARVLGGEAAPNTAIGAIDALAIAVRTYALVNLGRHASEGF